MHSIRSKTNSQYIKTLTEKRIPDFSQLLTILNGGKADRPTLFELFLNDRLNGELAGDRTAYKNELLWTMQAFRNAGYDYMTLFPPCVFSFPKKSHSKSNSVSQNDAALIYDRKSFDSYRWPAAGEELFSFLGDLDELLIPGMKMIPCTPGGVLENVTDIIGFENLCYMLFDNESLIEDTFARVGEILLEYYKIVSRYSAVGALIVNDDWGFSSQTLLSPDDLRKYVIPWHKEFVEVIHKSGKQAILHSCGQLENVMDDVIDHIGFDAKHSYEDKILPVEQAYEKWGGRIAVLGGLDMDFVCTADPQDIYHRAKAMLDRTSEKGGYALGTGNSVPPYVPFENYYAILLAALENHY